MKTKRIPETWREELVRYGELMYDIQQDGRRCRVFYYKYKTYCLVEENGGIICVTRGGMEGNVT